jgi:urease accessory protein
MRHRRATTPLLAAIALVTTSPAVSLAHHMAGARTPATLLDGLLSGLAHPLIELPHLAAIALAGAVAARLQRPAWIAYFATGSFVGTLALALELPLSPSETLVAITPLLLAGFLFLRSPAGTRADALALLAVGVVHGMAFAESIVGAEPTPIAAYLLGLAIAELAVAGMAAVATPTLVRARAVRPE